MTDSFDINVLVNGSRCKLYNHRGRTFVEAKEGSEYVVEIKNNSWEKILAVLSVDGLNVIDGLPAESTGSGYIIDKYCAQKFYGFQYSDEKVATFKFGAFGAVKMDPVTGKPEIDPDTGKEIPLGYAASKQDGSEKNAGVIGVRIWDEIPKPKPPIVYDDYSKNNWANQSPLGISCSWASSSLSTSYSMTASYAINASSIINVTGCCLGTSSWSINASYNPNLHSWGVHSVSSSWSGNAISPGVTTTISDNSNVNYQSLFGGCAASSNTVTSTGLKSDLLKEAIADAKAVRHTALSNLKSAGQDVFNRFQLSNMTEDYYIPVGSSEAEIDKVITGLEQECDKASFDMETQWGSARNYKVKETVFERKEIIHSLDIYYASRESLIEMGVDLSNEKRVSFPESFKSEHKYAKPPKGWKA